MDGVLQIIDWGVTHGVAGLALLVAFFVYRDNRSKDREIAMLNEQRVGDLKQYTNRIEAIQDKVHKTADDLARFVDFSRKGGISR